ncbi:cytochrome P450 [Streptomyces sp. Tu 2975]|uniref:cytochrome P450 n=1 Tax=Streptomyces sp. Tu 2975 TaxID=2676871 RepID=UPI00135AF545|nr:cytochrome P450 [Streptomyces sp. Tu 2975]QIP84230.1 cytochrome P450 [Streptomyces sp. Tu 2975]
MTATAPGALPLLGHTLQFGRRPLEFLVSLACLGDLVEIRLGPRRAYVVCDPALTYQVLLDDRTFDKGGPFYDKGREIAGNGLATCPHRNHRGQRRLVQPAFRRERIVGYGAMVAEQVMSLIESWRHGQVIDVLAEMHTLMINVTARTLFAATIDGSDITMIRNCLDVIAGGVARRVLLPLPVLEKLPLRANRRFNDARHNLKQFTGRMIADYRAAGVDHGDLFSVLLTAGATGGGGLSDDEIHDQVLTFFIAGFETTATTLSWIWHLLGSHPAVRTELHTEVDTVLDGAAADHTDLARLDVTGRVITEALRLWPPAWLFTRTTTSETELAGRLLPAGTTLLYSPYLLHRQADLYPHPDRFDADRWLPQNIAPLGRGAMVPFGAGARKCIGDKLAIAEISIAVATITSRWQLDPVNTDVRPKAGRAALAPRTLHMRLRHRRPFHEQASVGSE